MTSDAHALRCVGVPAPIHGDSLVGHAPAPLVDVLATFGPVAFAGLHDRSTAKLAALDVGATGNLTPSSSRPSSLSRVPIVTATAAGTW